MLRPYRITFANSLNLSPVPTPTLILVYLCLIPRHAMIPA